MSIFNFLSFSDARELILMRTFYAVISPLTLHFHIVVRGLSTGLSQLQCF